MAYLKIEKQRLLGEYRKCKEASWAVLLRIKDSRTKLQMVAQQFPSINPEMGEFFDLGEVFYEVLTYYFMLLDHEDSKNKEDYGFVKKEFQNMIMDNLVVIEHAEKVMSSKAKLLQGENDNVTFGVGILRVVMS